MSLVIKNLDAPLGAEISGRDLSKPIAPNEVKTIEDVWRERLVVVFHDQKLSDPQLIAFSKNFGELDPPGPNPYGESFLKDQPDSHPQKRANRDQWAHHQVLKGDWLWQPVG